MGSFDMLCLFSSQHNPRFALLVCAVIVRGKTAPKAKVPNIIFRIFLILYI